MENLIILGAGGYGRTVADVAAQTGEYSKILFLDDNSAAPDVAGKCEEFERFRDGQTAFYPAFGNNESRMMWLYHLREAGCAIPTIIHPTAYVSPTAQVEPGTVILPHVIVNTSCVVKAGCIVNCGAIVDHGCVLEEGVHICVGAIVKADNRIPGKMKVEAGVVIERNTYQ
mgnify:CR=1 FL=1